MKKKNISLWRERIIDREASGLKLADWCVQLKGRQFQYCNRGNFYLQKIYQYDTEPVHFLIHKGHLKYLKLSSKL